MSPARTVVPIFYGPHVSRKTRRRQKEASRRAYLRYRNPCWAVEIKKTSLESRNLSDLLQGLGYRIVPGIVEGNAFTGPSFRRVKYHGEIWELAKAVRAALKGPAAIDPEFELGNVIDFSTPTPRRHAFLEAQSARITMTAGTVTLSVSPPDGLSDEERAAWEAERQEREYQAKLQSQQATLEPAFKEPRAVKVLELLNRDEHTGESLYKMYELMEGHPSNRRAFQAQFNVSAADFKRFGDAVHNPGVSGDRARHAYNDPPKSPNPMTLKEAEAFVKKLATDWLAFVRRQH